MTISPTVPASSLALDHPVCRTCALQYEPDVDRAHCRICEDERQYVGGLPDEATAGADGQQWTSLRQLAAAGYRLDVHEKTPGLWAWAPARPGAGRWTTPATARRVSPS